MKRRRKPIPRKSRKQQVKTIKAIHGDKFFNEIGAIGGQHSPTKFTEDSGKKAAEARWKAYHALPEEEKRQLRERKNKKKGA